MLSENTQIQYLVLQAMWSCATPTLRSELSPLACEVCQLLVCAEFLDFKAFG